MAPNPAIPSLCHRAAGLVVAALLTGPWPSEARADAPPPRVEIAPATSVAEAAAQRLAEPIAKRLVVRNDEGGYDVWLMADLEFEQMSEAVRRAIGSKRVLIDQVRVSGWTYLEPSRSYLLDLSGLERPTRVRLTRHRSGSLLEVPGVGTASQAPRWSPTYRPQPILLPHGPVQ